MYKRGMVLLLKIDDDGKVLWRRTYGSRDKDYEAQCIAVTPDGYLVGGCSEGYTSSDGGKDGRHAF